jgi:hypothetical protein
MSEIVAIAEAAVYVDDLEADEALDRDVLGPEIIGREAGRHVFLGGGDGVLQPSRQVSRPRATCCRAGGEGSSPR